MHGTVYGVDINDDVSISFLIYEIDIFLFVASNISNNISIRCIYQLKEIILKQAKIIHFLGFIFFLGRVHHEEATQNIS